MLVVVKQEHIENGMNGKSNMCPIALAIKDALVTTTVNVYRDKCGVDNIIYDLPYEANQFLHDYDNFEGVRPIIFCLKESSDNTF